MNITVIGCGGIGSYLIPPLVKSLASLDQKHELALIDGDDFEERNMSRQLFSPFNVGKNKAYVMHKEFVRPYPNILTSVIPEYIRNSRDIPLSDCVIVCVDNHVARKLALLSNAANIVISAANMTETAEAFLFAKEWKGIASLDPTLYYPEILTDETGSPVGGGCTADAPVSETINQTPVANFAAAAAALTLWTAWFGKGVRQHFAPHLPVRVLFNGLSWRSFSIGDAMSAEMQNS